MSYSALLVSVPVPLTVPPAIWNVPIDLDECVDVQRAAGDHVISAGQSAGEVQRAGRDRSSCRYKSVRSTVAVLLSVLVQTN